MNAIILHVETKERQKTCPLCGHTHLVKYGYRIRNFVGLPIEGKKITIDLYPTIYPNDPFQYFKINYIVKYYISIQ